MKLTTARVRLFRNIVDSGDVAIDELVTALVGKNEAGKSSFLEALYRLKPAYSSEFKVRDDAPRWRLRQDERSGTLDTVKPVTAIFELDDGDRDRMEASLGWNGGFPTKVTFSKDYENELFIDYEWDEPSVASALLRAAGVTKRHLGERPDSLGELASLMAKAENLAEGETPAEEVVRLRALLTKMEERGGVRKALNVALIARLPRFFLFNEWSELPGRIDLQALANADPEDLPSGMRTALALVRLSGASVQEFLESDYESPVAELEASANEITRQVFEYWSQNTTLAVDFQIESENITNKQGQADVLRYLQVRIRDQRHMMTTNFDARSTGFQWFFSFLAAFSEYTDKSNLIVLLDEPGLGLHAKAQSDLLRFINERLASQHQVLYTTHSPFMVEPGRLERIRLAEDSEDLEVAATVSADIRVRDPDTLFPLQGALGYDIAQALFVAGQNLVVEGISDFIFLNTLSDFLSSTGRNGLSEEWNVVPVGGASKIPTFVALLGTHLNVTVLVDSK